MKACIVFVFLMLLCTIVLQAAPIRNGAFTITQPDGSTAECLITGDEFYGLVHDANNYTLIQNPQDGWWEYAVEDGDSLAPSGYHYNSVNPSSVGLMPGLTDSGKLQEGELIRRERDSRPRSRSSSIGAFNNIVVFVKFNDQTEFPTTKNYEAYNNIYNCMDHVTGSLKDYIDETSNSQLIVQSYLYPAPSAGNVVSFTDSHPLAYYYPYDVNYNPGGFTEANKFQREYALVTSVANYLESNNLVPDALNIDHDNDGNVDNIQLITRGNPNGTSSIPWPHFWYFTNVNLGSINGKIVRAWTIIAENSNIQYYVCHEFCHAIGAPDYYHYNTNGVKPVDIWDIMGSGTNMPAHMLVHTKWKYFHWCPEPQYITTSGLYTLQPVISSPYAAYKFNTTSTDYKYYAEYRKTGGLYESILPGDGLIVYRVKIGLDGNANGPPDEVFLYRRNGNETTNGEIDNAFMSAQSGRTGLHQYSNPSSAISGVTGNLVLYMIGEAGSTISFYYNTTQPKTWTGSNNTDWNNASNWHNGVPASTDNVLIYDTGNNDPVINSVIATNKLWLDYTSTLTITGSLTINSVAEVTGDLIVSGASAELILIDNINFGAGGSIAIDNNGGKVYLAKNLTFGTGSSANITLGTLNFTSSSNTLLTLYTDVGLPNFVCQKNTGYSVTVEHNAGETLTINGAFSNLGAGSFYNLHGVPVYLYKGYTNTAGGPCYWGTTSSLNLVGTASATLNDSNAGSIFGSFVVNKTSATVYLGSDIHLKSDMNITSGILDSNSHLIEVRGNWQNTVGTTAFLEESGRVLFYGSGALSCSTETFYILEVNISGSWLYINGSSVTVNSYEWTNGGIKVAGGGSFIALDLADNGVFGTWTLVLGTIDLTQDITHTIDCNGSINLSGGTMYLRGGSGACYMPSANAGSLTMSAGTLDIAKGINLNTTFSFPISITGGIIRCGSSFSCTRTDLNLTAGRLDLYGTSDCNISVSSGSKLYNLYVNKAASREAEDIDLMASDNHQGNREEPHTRSNLANLSTNLYLNGTLTVNSGTLDLNAKTVECYGYVYVNSGGTLALDAGSILKVDDGITIYGGGTLEAIGTSVSNATITSTTTTTYPFNLESSANLSAVYTIFEKMNTSGVNLKSGSILNSGYALSYCTFRNGAASGTLLTINNSQTINIINSVFPANTWSGTYNITKSVAQGNVTITDATGSFGTSAYESDLYSRITWIVPLPDLIITQCIWSSTNNLVADTVHVTVTIKNNGTAAISSSFWLDFFSNLTAPPTVGMVGNKYFQISSLAVGASVTKTFTQVKYNTAGTNQSYVLVDPTGAIIESNESNNVYGPVSVIWAPLPAPSVVNITCNGNSNGVISWNYPVWASRYKIYRDTNPQGSFTEMLGTITGNTYPVSLTNSKYFYRIKAERD